MVVAMPRSARHLGIGKRSTVQRLRGRGGRERTEIIVPDHSRYPSDSWQPQFWQHRRRQKSFTDCHDSKHWENFRHP